MLDIFFLCPLTPSTTLAEDQKIERITIGEVGELFRSGRLSSLHYLGFSKCYKLKKLSGQGVWDHLTALEILSLQDLLELELDNEDDIPWRCLGATLCVLRLDFLPKLVKLPKGMHHLTALHSLRISYCHNLEGLPPWIACFSSLQSLHIDGCTKLKLLPEEMCHLTSLKRHVLHYNSQELEERCQKPTSADWPNIQHIPYIESDIIWRNQV